MVGKMGKILSTAEYQFFVDKYKCFLCCVGNRMDFFLKNSTKKTAMGGKSGKLIKTTQRTPQHKAHKDKFFFVLQKIFKFWTKTFFAAPNPHNTKKKLNFFFQNLNKNRPPQFLWVVFHAQTPKIIIHHVII